MVYPWGMATFKRHTVCVQWTYTLLMCVGVRVCIPFHIDNLEMPYTIHHTWLHTLASEDVLQGAKSKSNAFLVFGPFYVVCVCACMCVSIFLSCWFAIYSQSHTHTINTFSVYVWVCEPILVDVLSKWCRWRIICLYVSASAGAHNHWYSFILYISFVYSFSRKYAVCEHVCLSLSHSLTVCAFFCIIFISRTIAKCHLILPVLPSYIFFSIVFTFTAYLSPTLLASQHLAHSLFTSVSSELCLLLYHHRYYYLFILLLCEHTPSTAIFGGYETKNIKEI